MMKLLNYFIALCLIGGLASCGPDKPAEKPTPLSHAVVDYSTKSPTVNQVTGSSAILMVSASGGSTTHSGDAHKATAGDTITHTVTLKAPTMVQLVVQADTDNTSAIELEVFINDAKKSDATLTINKDYIVSGVNQFRFGNLEIPRILLSTGANTIKMVPKQSFTLLSAKYLARDLYSKDGVLSTTIYTQFAKVDNLESEPIWTRAYGLSQGVQMIPGPTLRFKPGDLLEVDIINELNGDKYADLHTFDSIQNAQVGIDEELADVALHGEFNVPHNLNNTNLHVHGLHVDPSKDDVTIVIVPEGKSTKDYDAPHQGHPVDAVKNPDSLNAFSVADQSVKPGRWKYQYKIPPTHLPGTHWFHPHKHGAPSAQGENGLAGTLVI
ncbi:MAG: multicopper oxidase domain-containing protein, partial [Bacteroidota bacterium]